MSKSPKQTNKDQEVLIRLQGSQMQDTETAIKAIEHAGGRILFVFPPRALIAAIPSEKKSNLLGQAGIQSIETEPVDVETMADAGDAEKAAVHAWNAHLRARDSSGTRRPSAGLSWDAPGHLPPDPPPDVQEMLRRRERDK